ncbi:MAG: sigma-70 family RNA polymerase sigma factor [Deltaproteobacteria bacterium]|nr:sigma-70 family RNA polymerase sigma factor [Deltaproteobacteria bacterium]
MRRMVFDEDSKIARKVQRGDRQAFEALLVKFERPVFSFIYHFFQDRALSEDLTQETFLRAYRFIDSFRPKERFSTWLFSIAKNICIDELRRLRKGRTVDIEAVDPDILVSDGRRGDDPQLASILAQQGEILRQVLTRLPEKYRTSIILFYFNELSYEEIAAVMRISLSNTKILLFRGKRMLLDLYRDESGGDV